MYDRLFQNLDHQFGAPGERLSRRELLRNALAGAAGLLLSDRAAGPLGAAAKVGKRVLVVGAGFGGLCAAYELAAAGYDVTVIEARRRVGGRVQSLRDLVPGKTVEAGGELIGGNHPYWAAYAKKFGLEFFDVFDKDFGAPILLDGRALAPAAARGLWEEMRRALLLLTREAASVDADAPWKHPEAERLDRHTTAAWIDSLDISPEGRRALTVQLTAINGMLPAWQSYLANLAMIKGGGLEKYWTETDIYQCAGGVQQLAEKFAAALGPERILSGVPVASIAARGEAMVAKLADGRRLEADDLVLAVPVSTWNHIAFDPPLPVALRGQMGNNVKFLAALRRRFWQGARNSPRCLTDGPVCLTWEATCNQPGADGACLTAFSGGPAVDQVLSWEPGERQERYLAQLAAVYPEIRGEFVRGRFMNWPCEPWSQGSYSFPAPGQVTTVGPILQAGLGRLHFAGEHCCYAFIGYMEGALNSGATLAKKLAQRDGVHSS